MTEVRVGIGVQRGQGGEATAGLVEALAKIAEVGLDHVSFGDHVSFHQGAGNDGLITAAALAMLEPSLPLYLAVYLLPLRHPVAVARQLATLAQLAPGRLVFGVGVGGEDRHEVEVCGVDPSSRGRRMDECLVILSGLLAGRPVTFQGEFFQLDQALIMPPPAVPIPIVVGGRSDAAVRRAGRFGDGWLGIWNSPRRFAQAVSLCEAEAARCGRKDVGWQHAMNVWCALGPTREDAGQRLAETMQAVYNLPFEKFERYCPYGRPADVAEFLQPYVEAGCCVFNFNAVAADRDTAIDGAAEIKRLLNT